MLQALHRLEERRLIIAEWGVTKNGRRARYYKITPAGRDHLRAESARLVDHLDAVVTILSAKTAK
jgi:PadR family transcriptional regulator PadR